MDGSVIETVSCIDDNVLLHAGIMAIR